MDGARNETSWAGDRFDPVSNVELELQDLDGESNEEESAWDWGGYDRVLVNRSGRDPDTLREPTRRDQLVCISWREASGTHRRFSNEFGCFSRLLPHLGPVEHVCMVSVSPAQARCLNDALTGPAAF